MSCDAATPVVDRYALRNDCGRPRSGQPHHESEHRRDRQTADDSGGRCRPVGWLPAKLLAHPDRVALRPNFEHWAAHYNVPADLLEALSWVESGWQRTIVSRTGAIGIGQLEPATVDHVRALIGIKLDPTNADDNIRMSARFLRFLLDGTGGDPSQALAAYYQGLRSVRTGQILAETKQYVATVLAFRPFFR